MELQAFTPQEPVEKPMVINPTRAFITVVGVDHTITVPSEILPGTTVAVVTVPATMTEADLAARRERFAATRVAIEAAMQAPGRQDVDDDELEARIAKARQASTA